MEPWIGWLVVAGVLVAMELGSGTFVLLMLATGPLAASLVARLGEPLVAQMVAAAVVSAICVLVLRAARRAQPRTATSADPDIHPDIGQTVDIPAWQEPFRTRAMYRGALWDFELTPPARTAGQAATGRYLIVEVRGNTLVVTPKD